MLRVVALNEAAAWSVIVLRCEGQTGIVTQWVHGLHQTLAEGGVAENPGAIVILQSARDDFSRRSRVTIDQHHDGIVFAVLAAASQVGLLGIMPGLCATPLPGHGPANVLRPRRLHSEGRRDSLASPEPGP